MSEPFTILGAGGWIGSALVASLRTQGREVQAIDRNDLPSWLASDDSPGSVIYAIGMTADFRQFPHETVEAHVSLLSQVLRRPGLLRLLYLSSTRVYGRSHSTDESAPIPCLSSDPSDIYTLSKLLGEALVLQDRRPGLRVVRLSNVVGPRQPSTTFLGALIKEASDDGLATVRQSPASRKDYVHLDDVTTLLPLIVATGKERIYNLGSGCSISHRQIAARLRRAGVAIRFHDPAGPLLSFPALSIERLANEFFTPANPLERLC